MKPSVVTLKYKVCLFLAFVALYVVLYVLPNFAPLFPPRQLPLLWIDRATPFLPWTFVVYLSDYVLAFTVILSLRQWDEFHRFVRMAFTVLILSGLFFTFFPTTYPRPVYPTDQPFFIQLLMGLVRGADTPNNCFPSMHVAITSACAFSMVVRGPRVSAFYWIWSALIFASTLTTKQHYFADIVGGLCVALSALALDRAWRKSPELRQRGQRWVAIITRLNL